MRGEVRRTLFQPWSRMSGWWLASSAASPTRCTNAIAAAKSANSKSRAMLVGRLAPPAVEPGQLAIDVGLAEKRHRDQLTRAEALQSPGADRQPRPARHRAAVRARPRRRGRRRHARVRLPARGARRCRRSPATCCPPGLSAGEIDAAVRERTLAGESIYELDASGARRARARPDRHPGAVPGVRRLLRGRRRDRRRAAVATRA